MPNKVNVSNFINLLQKASFNWSVPNIRIVFTASRIEAHTRGANSRIALRVANNIITGIQESDSWEMNFADVVKNVKSYLTILIPDDEGMANIEMKENRIIIKSGNQKIQCHFCVDTIPSVAPVSPPKTLGNEIVNFELDEEFITAYSLVKKVAGTFGKVYFGVENGKFFLEAGDRTTPNSNNMLISLQDVSKDDMFVAFDFKSLNDAMTLINGHFGDFSFRLGYIADKRSGLVSFSKAEEEVYYLISPRENV